MSQSVIVGDGSWRKKSKNIDFSISFDFTFIHWKEHAEISPLSHDIVMKMYKCIEFSQSVHKTLQLLYVF